MAVSLNSWSFCALSECACLLHDWNVGASPPSVGQRKPRNNSSKDRPAIWIQSERCSEITCHLRDSLRVIVKFAKEHWNCIVGLNVQSIELV